MYTLSTRRLKTIDNKFVSKWRREPVDELSIAGIKSPVMSAKKESTEVNAAVERLLELADRMRSEDFGFIEKDVQNIDGTIEAIQALEGERFRVHEKLETETIHASILRHKLQFLPGEIKKEIKAAVESARQSNADVLQKLQEQLDGISHNTVYLEKRQQELDKQNAVLHPQRELVKEQHEQIISQLNQRMAEKASLQITLNETRDKVRQTNQDIVDLEDGILQLKEDLIVERKEARTEKKKLKRAVTDTTEKTKDQRVLNIVKKKELDVVHEQLLESEGKLESIRRDLRKYETSKAKLEGQERALNAQHQKQLKQNGELRNKGNAIIKEDMQSQQDFEDNEKQLRKKVEKMKYESEREEEKSMRLQGLKMELHLDLEQKMKVRQVDAENVSDLNDELQAEKRALAMKAEEMGRMQAENVEMHDQIENLDESHRAVMAQLNKQIEDYREQLGKERKESPPPEPVPVVEPPAPSPSPPPPPPPKPKKPKKNKLSSYYLQTGNEPNYGPPAAPPLINVPPRPPLSSSSDEDDTDEDGIQVQDEKNSVSKKVEDFKVDNQKYLSDMNKKIQEGKVRHVDLSNEGANLQRELKLDEQEISNLSSDLSEVQGHYETMYTSMQGRIELMEMQIVQYERAIVEKKKKIEEETPIFHDLEKLFEERTNAYDELKRGIAKMRQKKSALDEQIRKTLDAKDNLVGPKEKLKESLRTKRAESIEQLKKHGEERQKMEREIYQAGCKLKRIIEENKKIEDGCNKYRADMDELQKQMDEDEHVKEMLQNTLAEAKGCLTDSWKSDRNMEERYTERDQIIVDDLGKLMHKTEKRSEKISEISDNLEGELMMLAGFLENLATRRPRGKKKQKDKRHSRKQDKVCSFNPSRKARN
ncbi:shootin-1-like isoform X1 [Mizuhopecten yessoensis]|uniref:shootin-1-like isoform X1 n=1 Tax=Mizuhopecten yessoensis TaxID=6573 RepID=UPI000B45B2A9|nr:shootin-1-like isoform X1 [Mizuhopecten yessoensis]